MTKPIWKNGRGKLGPLDPLLGHWVATADTPMGRLKCTREFTRVLGKNYVLLNAKWDMEAKVYEELAYFGVARDGTLSCWSFTNDGKNSQGHLVDATDVHPEAVAFEAEMPAGTARQIYWPGEGGVIKMAVESKTKKGWNRFTKHEYRACAAARSASPPWQVARKD